MKTVELYGTGSGMQFLIEGISEACGGRSVRHQRQNGFEDAEVLGAARVCAHEGTVPGRSSTSSPASLMRSWHPTRIGRRSSGIHPSAFFERPARRAWVHWPDHDCEGLRGGVGASGQQGDVRAARFIHRAMPRRTSAKPSA